MTRDDFLDMVASCVASIPHKVEWFEDEEMQKLEKGEEARATVEIQNSFILPSNVIDAMGGSIALFDACKGIAERYHCNFYKANDGSFVFKSRLV
jgi:hypothetical protein